MNGAAKSRWFEWVPGWVPICVTIFGAALWVGRYTQGIDDRIQHLEEAVKEIQAYIVSHDRHAENIGPISQSAPTQDANAGPTHY